MIEEGISGYGTTISGATFGVVGFVRRLSIPGLDATVIDASHMASPDKWKQKVAGMKDARQMQLEVIYEESQMGDLLDALGDDNEDWTVTFPDGATFTCSGFIQSLGQQVPMDDMIMQSINIELSGKPTFLDSGESSNPL
jgi:predicted secreted protein